MRKDEKHECGLKTKIEKPETPPTTPEIEGPDDEEEEGNLAITKIQSILTGRASQILVCNYISKVILSQILHTI